MASPAVQCPYCQSDKYINSDTAENDYLTHLARNCEQRDSRWAKEKVKGVCPFFPHNGNDATEDDFETHFRKCAQEKIVNTLKTLQADLGYDRTQYSTDPNAKLLKKLIREATSPGPDQAQSGPSEPFQCPHCQEDKKKTREFTYNQDGTPTKLYLNHLIKCEPRRNHRSTSTIVGGVCPFCTKENGIVEDFEAHYESCSRQNLKKTLEEKNQEFGYTQPEYLREKNAVLLTNLIKQVDRANSPERNADGSGPSNETTVDESEKQIAEKDEESTKKDLEHNEKELPTAVEKTAKDLNKLSLEPKQNS